MSFYLSHPSHYRNTYEPNFGSLFRLLSDFDNFRSEVGAGTERTTVAHFTPKFDFRETEHSFELHGELPGVEKENVSIEFTNPQTIEIRGKVDRTYTAGTPPANWLEEGSTSKDKLLAHDEGTASETQSHKATVEDAGEDGDKAVSEGTAVKSPKTEKAPEKKDGARYWVRERSFGSFSRQFTFPTRVDTDNVQASYKDGVLNVTVPKAKKPESRRIAIQ